MSPDEALDLAQKELGPLAADLAALVSGLRARDLDLEWVLEKVEGLSPTARTDLLVLALYGLAGKR